MLVLAWMKMNEWRMYFVMPLYNIGNLNDYVYENL